MLQFRWRNWRFDILWAVIYFGICSSFFPLCGVYGKYHDSACLAIICLFSCAILLNSIGCTLGDYLKYNPTHHPGYLLAWVSSRVLILFTQIFISGRLSLLFTILVIMLVYGFTDWSNLKLSTHFGWSLFHALVISSPHLCVFCLWNVWQSSS